MGRMAERLASAVITTASLGAIAVTAHTLFNLARLRRPPEAPESLRRRVSVLIPARDEAAYIGHCLTAARQQQGVPDLEILVLDDRSSDHTAQVVRHHTVDPRVRLVDGAGEPPAGWLGKPWACQQLADEATGDVFVFLDADVLLEPYAVVSAVAMLDPSWDAVSPYPRQQAITWGERLVQPLLQWSWLTFLPLRLAETSARESLTAANGQFLLIERGAYEAIGGHASVRDDVIDDVGLFRSLTRHGRRGIIADGTHLATCRMYNNWHELSDGYSKSLWSAYGSAPGALAATSLLCALYVLPAAAMLKGSRIGAVGYLAGVCGRVAVARRVEAKLMPDAFLQPASISVLTYLTALSWYRRSRGQLQWKGRPVAPNHLSETT